MIPSFKKKERKILTGENIHKWIQKITCQISLFVDFKCHNRAIIVNNYDWFKKINIINFLRNIGKCFSINTMINKSSVKKRINRTEKGISFTEFSYSLLQAYDFLLLYKKYNAILQIGGSDQWGNIISGINLVDKLYHKNVYGLTTPLLTTCNGSKFGKTEIGTIWLDSKKTSPFNFYQYWINIPDTEVFHYLKMFTSFSLKEIHNMQLNNKKSENFSNFRKMLADYITLIIHGKEGLSSAQRITNYLFTDNIQHITLSDIQQLIKDGVKSIQLKHENSLQNILVLSSLATSKNNAKTMICSKAIRINKKIQTNWKYQLTYNDKLFTRYTLLSRGKKNHCLICW